MAEEKKIATGYIGNALRSVADNHTTTFADEIFDTERQKYQNEVNTDIETKISAETARAKAAEQAIIFDVSAHNDGAVFESLQTLLSSSNLSTLIPESVRYGGMTIRFIQGSEQSYDNKYVQYKLKTTSFSTKEEDWAICNDEFYTQTSDWAYVLRDSVGHILAGIQYNGEVEWALGVPTPVKDYVNNAVSQILNGNSGTTIDGLNKVFSFLSNFSTSDTLQTLLNTKKDKNDPLFDILSTQSISDLSQVILDKSERIIESMDVYGNFEHYTKHNFKRIGFEALEENATSLITGIVEDVVTSDNIEVELTLENGVFNGGGNDVAATTWIRSQKIQCDGKSTVIAICPETMDIICNFETESLQRGNIKYPINAGVSVSNPKDFIRFGFMRRDGSVLNIENLTQEERNGIHVFIINRNENQVRLAAYNSSLTDKANADIVCTDNNAQFILNACISCIGDIDIKLSNGDYNLYKILYSHYNEPCMIKTQDVSYNVVNQIKLSSFGIVTKARINMTQESYALCNSTETTSMVLVPCRNEDGVSIYPISKTYIHFDGVDFWGYDYIKPVIILNLAFGEANIIHNLSIRSDKYEEDNGASNLHVFRTTPHIGCIGLRLGFGSNDGINNHVKSTVIWYLGKGVSCAGEHYIFEDVLTHHCYIGWVFGDYHTTGHFEHPNMMIGCSIEGCYRLMYLTKGGITEEGEFVPDYNNNLYHSTLVCTGLSTEEMWDIPLDEREEGGSTTQRTLPILEVLKGAYRGSIELDTATDVFETGSGRAFTWRKYRGGQTILGHGNTIDNIYQ